MITKREESSNHETKKFQIPLEVTPENKEMLFAAGYTEEDFTIRLIADRRCRVILVDVSEEVYLEYMDSEWREAKQRTREHDRFVSLAATLIEDIEPIENGFEDAVFARMTAEDIYDMLFEIEPIYAEIFCMRYEGATQQEIAEELRMCRRTICDYDKRIRQIVQEHIKKFFE